jgi:ferredoxin
MAYVVQEPCHNCKYGDCVEVCPVTCFFETDDMLYINPAECIDCDACVPACPVEAIVNGDSASKEWKEKAEKYFESNPSEDARRSAKKDVTHGPKWDPKKAVS